MRKILILSLGFALSLGAQAKDYHRTADTTTVVCRLSADGRVGEMLGITLLDHIIIGDHCYTSMLEQGI